jgi:hypothetical protein
MPYFTPELVQTMRDVLDQAAMRLPLEYATPAVKAYLAECILKAAAQGHTSYDTLLSVALDQFQNITSIFT